MVGPSILSEGRISPKKLTCFIFRKYIVLYKMMHSDFGDGESDERSKEVSDELVDAEAADSLIIAEGAAVYESPGNTLCFIE